MKTKTFKGKAEKFNALQKLAVTVQTGTKPEITKALFNTANNPLFSNKQGWRKAFGKLACLIGGKGQQYEVFTKGNSKLPFVSFSTLPAVTCPGAGECLEFCYSFTAWRYPAAFARQFQNAWLMRFNRGVIHDALASHVKALGAFDLRLYVDGDFSSVNDVSFWMHELNQFPTVRAYGYSKSFAELLQYSKIDSFPSNYVLNVSSGHCHDNATIEAIKALPITRGEFIAVNIGRKVKSTDHGTKATNDALRKAYGAKAFTCPGQCGTCTGKGHACGMQSLKGLPIIIAVH